MSGSSIVEQPPNASTSGWRRLFNKSSSSSNTASGSGSKDTTKAAQQPNGTLSSSAPDADSPAQPHTDDDAQETSDEAKHPQGIAPPPEEEPTEDTTQSPLSQSPETPRAGPTRRASDTNAVTFAESVPTGAEDPALDEIDETPAPIEFLHKGAPYFWLSNHFQIPIYYDNIRYASSEHLFQSLKFPHRPDIAKQVRKAETPSDAVRIARKNAQFVRDGWRRDGLNIVAMREVLLLKFTQHSALRSRLIQTGE